MQKKRVLSAIVCAIALTYSTAAQSANDLKVLQSEEDYGIATQERDARRTTTEEWENRSIDEENLNVLSKGDGNGETVKIGWDAIVTDDFIRNYNDESYGEIDGKEFRGKRKISDGRQYGSEAKVFTTNGMFAGENTDVWWRDGDVVWSGKTKSEYDFEVNEDNEILRTGKIKTEVDSKFSDKRSFGYMEIESKIKGERASATGEITYQRGVRDNEKTYKGEVSMETYPGEDGTRSGYGSVTLTSSDGRHKIYMKYDIENNHVKVDCTVIDKYLLDSKEDSYEYSAEEGNPFADADRLARKFHFLDDLW